LTERTGPARRPRLLAIISLAATVALTVMVVVFLVTNAGWVALGVVGLVLSIAGAWWTITENMPRRAAGIVGLVVGAAAMVGALVAAADDLGQVLVRLIVTLALLAVAVASARAALSGDTKEMAERAARHRRRPARPVLICNPKSGGGKVEQFGLVDLARSLGVETVTLAPGLDLEKLATEAVEDGADCLGMAGGDGSQALVASIAVRHDLPFVCVSAGTRNHFALDLGLNRDDPRDSVYAFRDAIPRRVDFATVNDRLFVNNVSLGVYATIVQQESYRDAKVDTSRTLLPELLGRTERPFDLQFTTPDGTEVDGAFLIMVSNNPYVLAASLDMSQRRRLDSGALGVFAVTASTGVQAARVVTLALAGRSDRSGQAYQFATDEFEVRSKSGEAYAGVDGEALQLPTPLRFRIHPRGLQLLVPEGNIENAIRRGHRDVHLGDMWSMARGRAPTGS
jgi:diacylglycerol kinase family enzyme